MASKMILPNIEMRPARATVGGVRRVGWYYEKDGQHHFVHELDIMTRMQTGEQWAIWVLPFEEIELADVLSNPDSPVWFKD